MGFRRVLFRSTRSSSAPSAPCRRSPRARGRARPEWLPGLALAADRVGPAGAEARVARLASLVPALDRAAEPAGSLGRLEELGIRLAAIAGRCPPPVPANPALLVAAGDHGVVAQGVTPWPQAVTGAMVTAMTAGQAAVNAIAGAIGAEVRLLDAGVAAAPAPHPMVRQGNVRRGTADLAVAAAMTREQAALAVLEGAAAAGELLDAGADLLLTGDMGIGNTTAAACLIAALTGLQPVAVTGRGTGIDDTTSECWPAWAGWSTGRSPGWRWPVPQGACRCCSTGSTPARRRYWPPPSSRGSPAS